MVTGASGYVGRHVVNALLAKGHTVVAVARDVERARRMPWFDRVSFLACDLQERCDHLFAPESMPQALVHLAWPGLPHYKQFFHIEKNLPADLSMLTAAVRAGVPQILVAGTCLEYGMRYGPLHEDMATDPHTPYGFAKDTLRKALQLLQLEIPFVLQWMSLFYSYGEGQNANSLHSQLDKAIETKQAVFNMSKGDQLRDYLPIEKVAAYFALALDNSQVQGVMNCCSGQPVSVLDIVKMRMLEKNSAMQLNSGFYPYANYEPLAFWGVPAKLASLQAYGIAGENVKP